MTTSYQLTPRGKFIAEMRRALIEGRFGAAHQIVIDYEMKLKIKHLAQFVETERNER